VQENNNMSAIPNPIRGRYEAFFETDFMPLIRHDQTQGAEERSAYADEFAAYHLGQIDKKLGRLIELLEQSAKLRP
jgi:transposase